VIDASSISASEAIILSAVCDSINCSGQVLVDSVSVSASLNAREIKTDRLRVNFLNVSNIESCNLTNIDVCKCNRLILSDLECSKLANLKNVNVSGNVSGSVCNFSIAEINDLKCTTVVAKWVNGANGSLFVHLNGIKSNVQEQIDELYDFKSFSTISTSGVLCSGNVSALSLSCSTIKNNVANIKTLSCTTGKFNTNSASNAVFIKLNVLEEHADTISCCNLNVSNEIACENINVSKTFFSPLVNSSTLKSNSVIVTDIRQSGGKIFSTDLTCTSFTAAKAMLQKADCSSCSINTASITYATVDSLTCSNVNGVGFENFEFLKNLSCDVQLTLDTMLNLIYEVKPSLDNFVAYAGTFTDLVAGKLDVRTEIATDGIVTETCTVNTSLFTEDLFCTGQAKFAQEIVQGISDSRLKNVNRSGSMLRCLDLVLNLNPVHYDLKPDAMRGKQQKFGFLAQEVQPFFPEMVKVSPLQSLLNLDPPLLTVDYEQFVPVLAGAIQELYEIVKLHPRINFQKP
jgi:hypothetical protein